MFSVYMSETYFKSVQGDFDNILKLMQDHDWKVYVQYVLLLQG